MSDIDLDNYDYHPPPAQIVQHPTEKRDESRIPVLDPTGANRIFRNIIEYFRPEDVLVLNNTKVASGRRKRTRLLRGSPHCCSP